MKRYQKPLVMLTLLALSVQSYADVLQTSVGANHSAPKVTNQTQNATTSQSIEINPYGKLNDVNQDQAEVVGIDFDQNPFIYGSGYHDTESNLEYMGARYYSADTGRFMAQDSYDLINRYNYANANPIMYVDPDGHMSKSTADSLIGSFELLLAVGLLASGGGTFFASILAMAGTTPMIAGIVHVGDQKQRIVTTSDMLGACRTNQKIIL